MSNEITVKLTTRQLEEILAAMTTAICEAAANRAAKRDDDFVKRMETRRIDTLNDAYQSMNLALFNAASRATQAAAAKTAREERMAQAAQLRRIAKAAQARG